MSDEERDDMKAAIEYRRWLQEQGVGWNESAQMTDRMMGYEESDDDD